MELESLLSLIKINFEKIDKKIFKNAPKIWYQKMPKKMATTSELFLYKLPVCDNTSLAVTNKKALTVHTTVLLH